MCVIPISKFVLNLVLSIFLKLFKFFTSKKTCIAYDPSFLDFVDFKKATEPLWLLGRQYKIENEDDYKELNEDIRSKLWFTYRKQFPPIGDTYLTSDYGWGCMHRCGQMVMAQALMWRFLGQDWKWKPDCSLQAYKHILEKFNDRFESQYSIHRIALKGSILEKRVGEWFGPNTIVQVLKRLAEEDTENDMNIHVAMDNMVIKSEIKKLFKKGKNTSPAETQNSSSSCDSPPETKEISKECVETNSCSERLSHPILLTIPLRLGLSEITPVYFNKLKAVFTFKQSLGMIGGRTNHASYFIGYIGDELIYLDPHITQMYRNESPMEDFTYHCQNPSRMNFSQLDPSIALCFYLENESDFDQWCAEAQKILLEPEKDAIFEILEEKPAMLPYADIDTDDDCCVTSFTEKDRVYTSDDEFELLM